MGLLTVFATAFEMFLEVICSVFSRYLGPRAPIPISALKDNRTRVYIRVSSVLISSLKRIKCKGLRVQNAAIGSIFIFWTRTV